MGKLILSVLAISLLVALGTIGVAYTVSADLTTPLGKGDRECSMANQETCKATCEAKLKTMHACTESDGPGQGQVTIHCECAKAKIIYNPDPGILYCGRLPNCGVG